MNDQGRKGSELGKFEWNMLQKWRKLYTNPAAKYYYSYRVGGGVSTEGIKERWLRKCIFFNSRLKIDCVVYREFGPHDIVEVKRVATPGAIGQLLCYAEIYKDEQDAVNDMILLCCFASSDMYKLCDKFGIKLIIINPD